MPARPPKAGSDGPLLKTWRQEGTSGTKAKIWLTVRRVAAFTIALALIGWLAYLMLSPLWLPKSYFAYLCADELEPLVAPPLEYTAEDFAGFAQLANALTPAASGGKPLTYGRISSPALLQAELDSLKGAAITSDHPVIVFVSAHGIVRDGKAYLMCGNFTAAEGNKTFDGLYAVTKLVKQLAEVPGGIKLLLLDACRNDYAPRLGMIENTFAAVLKEELAGLKLPSVWVLNSSSPGERSHVSPALRRSVFGYLCATGLQGAADANDDGKVHLTELADFVPANVAAWVKRSTGDVATQTPMLLSAGGVEAPSDSHLLYTTNLPEVEPVSSLVTAAQDEDARVGIVAAVQDYLSDEVDEFGLTPIFTAIGTAKEKLGLDAEDADEPTEEVDDEPGNAATIAAQRESQNEVELALFDEAWRLTEEVANSAPHPASYAPQLWRLHLDRLVWLEYQQQSGERMNQLPLIDELRSTIQSLRSFGKLTTRNAKKPNVVDRLRRAVPTVPLAAGEAPTLALAQAIAATDPQRPLPGKLPEFIKAYDAWLGGPDGMDQLDAIKEANWDDAWSDFYELQLLDNYRNDADVPLEAAKLAFEVRRLGERVTADLSWGQGWAADVVDEADRLRLEAERLLADHADAEWLDKATTNLQRARTLYTDARTQLVYISDAKQLASETLIRARDYLRWSRYCWGDAASRAPSAQRIEALLASLEELRAALDAPDGVRAPSVNDLQRIHNEIERLLAESVDELASSPYEPGDAERITALLKTALLTAEQRGRCIEARNEADEDLMRSFETVRASSARSPLGGTSSRDKLAIDHLKAEHMLLAKFSPRRAERADEWPSLDDTDSDAIAAGSSILGDWLYDMNTAITSAAQANANLDDLNRRAQRLEQLRHAMLGLYLIDAVDATTQSQAQATVVEQLRNAMWYDLLSATRERFVRAQADAPPAEAEKLRLLANRCGAVASQIPNQPEVLNISASQLTMQVPNATAELITAEETTIDFSVQSFGQDGPVWVVAQYDANAIDVVGVNWTILKSQDIERAAINEDARLETGYPYWPQARRGLTETMMLAAGQSRTMGIKVRRVGNARGNTTLVLKAISNRDYIRHEVPVRLPGRQDLEISVAGARTIRRSLENKVGLFANRTQELTIYLANTGTTVRSVIASVYAPQQTVKASIPTGSIEASAAEQILQRVGSRNGIAIGSTPLTLSPGSPPVAVRFDFQTPENKALLGANPKDGPIKIAVPNGLLLDIVDQETREHTIRWLQFEVWRPHAFLDARATYDPGSRRLRITAEAVDPAACPEGEVQLTLDVDRRFVSARGGGTYTTFLKAPNYRGELETTLTGRWPREFDPLADDYLPVRVSVDHFPRGFEFRLPKTTTLTTLRPTRDKTSLRFLAPPAEAEFAAADFIATQVEVEVPEGFFNVPNSYVEIGIDKNQDRELRGEESTVLRSDRQLELFVKVPTDGGTLAFEPRVGDFQLNLRTTGISNRAVNILGQLTTAGRVADRSYRPIVLDGEGPALGVIKLSRNGTVLVVEANPQDLTGVKSVEAAFESAEEVKWQPGKRGEGGQWLVELETKELSPGNYTVLLRATDEVGNRCDVASTPWTNDAVGPVAPTPTETDSQAAVPGGVKNQVKGRLRYGTQTVTEIEVTLTGAGAPAQPARAGAGGTFNFGLVPPGTYSLKARGLAGGNYHKAEMQITVSDQPETPLELEVRIR